MDKVRTLTQTTRSLTHGLIMQSHVHTLITYDYKWKNNRITLDGYIEMDARQSTPHSTHTPST